MGRQQLQQRQSACHPTEPPAPLTPLRTTRNLHPTRSEFDFVRQQQAAAKLGKLAPAGSEGAARAAWWVVASLALQARAGALRQDARGQPLALGAPGGLPHEKLLQLAESMAARQAAAVTAAVAAAGDKPAAVARATKAAVAAAGWSYEALLLQADLLQGQGRAREALQVRASGPAGRLRWGAGVERCSQVLLLRSMLLALQHAISYPHPSANPPQPWQVLEGPLGDAVPLPADRLQLRAAALARAGDLPAAAACYREALAAAPDDWASWLLFLDCCLPGSGGGEREGATGSRFPVGVVDGMADLWDRRQPAPAPLASPDAAAALDATEAAIVQLSAELEGSEAWHSAAQRGTLRALHLWRCELLLRRARLARAGAAGVSPPPAEELAAAVGEAFGRLAANFSCVADLRPYLAELSGPAAEQLAADAHRRAAELNAAEPAAAEGDGAAPSEAGSEPANGGRSGAAGEVRRLQRQVNAHALAAELGLPRLGGAGEAAAHAGALLDLYRRHMHLSGGWVGLGGVGLLVGGALHLAGGARCRTSMQSACNSCSVHLELDRGTSECSLPLPAAPLPTATTCSLPGREGARVWGGAGSPGSQRPAGRRPSRRRRPARGPGGRRAARAAGAGGGAAAAQGVGAAAPGGHRAVRPAGGAHAG